MINRILVPIALLGSIGVGIAVGFVASEATKPADAPNSVKSITGVNSGAGGTDAKEPDRKGVETIVPEDVPPESSKVQPEAIEADAESENVEIQGVQGTDGTSVPPENTIESVSEAHGSIETIRGIEGIDAVMLRNLEAVLRMQQQPEEPQGQGGARSAAALLTMESDEPEETEEIVDSRQELVELELEGS
ncbi:MAG: hypothetical protein H8E44_10565 [Planctomycetes bacterium]|nr:hypothetical protein [Planctomycetota bacterium]